MCQHQMSHFVNTAKSPAKSSVFPRWISRSDLAEKLAHRSNIYVIVRGSFVSYFSVFFIPTNAARPLSHKNSRKESVPTMSKARRSQQQDGFDKAEFCIIFQYTQS